MNAFKTLLRTVYGKRLPITSGTVELDGIRGPVTIDRDRWGVPYIKARNDADAWFGLGFTHGQDRAFQIEILLRAMRGTLAALTGPDALPIDRLSRRIGFHRSAVKQLDALDDDVRETLESYARGVSAGATSGGRVAHEFAFLRSKPTPYEATDVLALMKLTAFLLASNWDSELVRYKMLLEDGVEAVKALDPTYPEWLPQTMVPGSAAGPVVDRLSVDLETFEALVGLDGGSNNWALSGERTASGRPIVANDPHLGPTQPSHWYLARVATPEWAVAGASLLGSPGFSVGFNGRCAWGVTAGLTDNTDLFLEEIGVDGTSVRIGDEFVQCEVHDETIVVKGGDSVVERVLETPHGPVIGPALSENEAAIAMRAVWLDARPLRGPLDLHKVETVEDIRQAYRAWPGLPLNVVSADESGDIAWQLVGEAPIRRSGWGTLPLPGWDAAAGWQDVTLSIDELPGMVNPDGGFIATANNEPQTDDDAVFIGFDFVDGYRAARISERLQERNDWTLEATSSLQMDRFVIPWREFGESVLGLDVTNERARRALGFLRPWDGTSEADSVAATVYEFFVGEMARRIVSAKAPNTAQWALGRGLTALTPENGIFTRRVGQLSRLLQERPDGWFAAGWDSAIEQSLANAIARIEDSVGTDESKWAWGVVRPLTIKHPLGDIGPLGKIFNLGPFAWGGNAATINQAAVSFLDPQSNALSIASLRMAIEVGEWDRNHFVLPGGQSGNPFSPHYSDQLDLYRAGGSISIAWSEEKRKAIVKETLELVSVNP